MKDLTGMVFGRLTVIKFVERKKNQYLWECECSCSEKTHRIVSSSSLISGNTKSCGCLHKEQIAKSNYFRKKWDIKNKRIYNIWRAINHRCYFENDTNYSNYGGRGIKVCDEWKKDFHAFQEWALTNGYADNLSIDRINNDGNYCPENCEWVDGKAQANNKTTNKYITFNGETKTLAQWCEELNLDYFRTKARLNNCHWTVEQAFTNDKYVMVNSGKNGKMVVLDNMIFSSVIYCWKNYLKLKSPDGIYSCLNNKKPMPKWLKDRGFRYYNEETDKDLPFWKE